MRTRNAAGQASLEYVGLLALAGAVLAVAAGVAFAVPAIPRSVVHAVRLGICIVGGDVCRPADAAARGLEPCLVSEDARDHEDRLGAMLVEAEGGRYAVRRASDGTWTLTVTGRHGADLSTSTGLRLGPIQASAGAAAGLRFATGAEWTLPETRIRALLARMKDPSALADPLVAQMQHMPPPTREFTEDGAVGRAEAAAALGRHSADAAADAGLLLGRRRGAGPDVWYFRTSGALDGAAAALGLGAGAFTAEYHATSPPSLVLRTDLAQSSGTEVEHVLTWPLRTADARSLAQGALAGATHLGAFVRRAKAEAIQERRTYRTTTGGSDVSLQVLGIGFAHHVTTLHRQLVDARVLTGPVSAVRYDCLGVDRP
jgi:hypothetical protein